MLWVDGVGWQGKGGAVMGFCFLGWLVSVSSFRDR